MASNKGKGRGPGRRRRAADRAWPALPDMERLERRTLLSAPGSLWKPTSTDLLDPQNGPLALAGPQLITAFGQYEQFLKTGKTIGFSGDGSNGLAKTLFFNTSDAVAVDARGFGDFNTFVASLQTSGMQVANTDATREIAEGWLPLADLPAVAALPQIVNVMPVFRPDVRAATVNPPVSGQAPNQSDQALFADVARSTFGVNGTGVTVGVLSDSVNRFKQGALTGLAASQATGDLPTNPPVQVLLDEPVDPLSNTDEGRAMLEQIHDIAPGAKLQFNTTNGNTTNALAAPTPGELGFAQGIRALAAAGSSVIVDDVGYFTEPFFQDGPIAQAVTDVVTNHNASYFSATGNAKDAGYLSEFRPVATAVPGITGGQNVFQNFNPNPGQVATTLPITITGQGVNAIIFQYDNPFYSTATSDIRMYLLDAANNIVAKDSTNHLATQTPFSYIQSTQLDATGTPKPIAPGNYQVVIQDFAGPQVGHVVFYNAGGNITINKALYGNGGGTFYPTSFGHPDAREAIAVGAAPWWDLAPFNPVQNNEVFSSFGPDLTVFNPDGSRLGSPEVRLKPDISAPDGNDTSFFIPGFLLRTTNPPPNTGVPSPTELDGDPFPNFLGTSSAAPNAAAVAALMKQLNPSQTPAQIKAAMIASTVPLNGQAKGQYDQQAGFGLLQAPAALSAAAPLTVVSTSPGAFQTVTSAPQYIDVVFNKAVNLATLAGQGLQFFSTPPGITATVGTAILLNPTTVRFPITLTPANPSITLNGPYGITLPAGALTSTDSQPLTTFTTAFTVQDIIAPRITSTAFDGRIGLITFDKPLRASTVNKNTIQLLRTGPAGVFNGPTGVNVLGDPRAQLIYFPASNQVAIDLRALDQTELPSDHYALVVSDSLTDVAGNPLDGEFFGSFPSGDGGALGDSTPGGTFVQDLGDITLTAPVVTSLGLDPASDSGTVGDSNTNVTRPVFRGTVHNTFPGQFANLLVAVQFTGPRGNVSDLGVGLDGRGFVGNPDLPPVRTDANGGFSFQAPFDLPDGLQRVRVVVVGESDAPPSPGLASQFEYSFRIDTSHPFFVTPSIPYGAPVSSLTNLSITVADPVFPPEPGNPLGVPTQLDFPALDPASAANISNYALINLGPDRTLGTADDVDLSSFITSATFVSTTNRVSPSDPYIGRVDLTFAPGLPSGLYAVFAKAKGAPGAGNAPGIVDAAGNQIDQNPTFPGNQSFGTLIDLKREAAFITNFAAFSRNSDGTLAVRGPRSYYEVPAPGATPRADAPPFAFVIDFSSPLDPSTVSNDSVQLIRSADAPGAPPDGDFGTGNGLGFSRVAGTSVQLTSSVLGSVFGQPGYNDRLIVTLPANTTLGPDHYRIVIPSTAPVFLRDLFGQVVDGEFLGAPTATGGFQVLLPNGQVRAGLSGDGVPGGTFETGFVVVPTGNIIFARPDYIVDPFNSATYPDGSVLKPYPTLAPQASPNATNGGDLNNVLLNSGPNFDPVHNDREQSGHFDPSAFVAAQALSARGPVVVVALPSATSNKTYVLALPPRVDPNDPTKFIDGSASVPFDTTLVFQPRTTLRLFNASLFAQNQGSAIQALGTPNAPVTFTSFYDPNFGGITPPGARGGDWGGIVYRNFDQGGLPSNLASLLPGGPPAAPGPVTYSLRPDRFPVDGILQGPGGTAARSGADEALSILNFANLRFGGGPVPQTLGTLGTGYDVVELFNSRPTLTNLRIADSATPVGQPPRATGAQAAIGADYDSFREDDLARGPLIRNISFVNNSINGVLLRAQANGVVQETDAIHYADNPLNRGGARNFTFDDPVPIVVASRFELGTQYLYDSSNQEIGISNRTYIQPGMLFKFQRGAGLEIDPLNVSAARLDAQASGSLTTPGGNVVDRPVSLNIGDRNYLAGFDNNPFYAPVNLDGTPNPDFQPESPNDARTIFTSFYDAQATTAFIDPVTGRPTTIVPANDTANAGGIFQPTPGNVPDIARWGSFGLRSGAVAIINAAEFRYGGGTQNTAGGSIGQRPVLDLENARAIVSFDGLTRFGGTGTHTIITNNNFFDNIDVPVNITPDGLLAAPPLYPLVFGKPYFRGNVMQRNGIDALGVSGGEQDVNAVWDQTDLTYVLRSTVFLSGAYDPFSPYRPVLRTPSATTLLTELTPVSTLTIQSVLADTLLPDGQRIPRPGQSTVVKLLGADPTGLDGNLAPRGDGSINVGAGFEVGVDDGVDPDRTGQLDPGMLSQIRILGIGGNESLNTQRVPVVITSVHDSTVGPTVRGVDMTKVISGDTVAPAAGDGGGIYFGGNSLYTYNLYDLREGNRIDNADLRYLSKVETQGGGFFDNATGNIFADLQGKTPLTQNNANRANAISDTNIANFRDVGIYAHGGFAPLSRLVTSIGGTVSAIGRPLRIATPLHNGNTLFLVNSTIANTPLGVKIAGDLIGSRVNSTDAVLLHNTFYNDATAVLGSSQAGVEGTFLSMNNIYANSSTASINSNLAPLADPAPLSQYDLFFQAGLPNIDTKPVPTITGDPLFRNAAGGDFNLRERGANGIPSAAIDAARSELGPSFFGGLLTPIADQVRSPTNPGVLDPTGLSVRNATNRDGSDFVALPGLPNRAFFDQFVPTLATQTNSRPGPASNAATFNYAPIAGQRDQRGFLRQDDPGVPNVGFGAQPFFDIGAFEFRQLFPPHVIGVTAVTDPTNPTGVNIYRAGGIGGTNKSPLDIKITFDNRIDPTTINAQSVLLEVSNGTGLFNVPQDTFLNLAGKLAFDNATDTLTIDTSGLRLANDEYRVILKGTGPAVLRDPQGNALDGFNIDPNNPNPNTNQLPLPSGTGFPGSDFQVTFTVKTAPPVVVPATFALAAASDSNRRDGITRINTPTFVGSVTDVFPPLNARQGLIVILDISSRGDGVFDIPNAGSAVTDANGNFSITVNQPLPDSPYVVGPDGFLSGGGGLLGGPDVDDSGFSVAHIRVADQSGNVSNPVDPNSFTSFVIDTQPPRVLASTPTPASLATVVNGRFHVGLVVSQNIDPASLTAAAITLTGPAGTTLAVDTATGISIRPLHSPQGAEAIDFDVTGATANGTYSVSLASSIIDIAGNPLAANGGSGFTIPFVVLNPTLSRIIYVDGTLPAPLPTAPAPTGTRANPFRFIGQAMGVASIGDTVAVLPAIYNENIGLKTLVRLVSADPTSTSTQVVPGNPLTTVIRGVAPGSTGGTTPLPTGALFTVLGNNLASIPGFSTELSGFTIASPLVGDPATGFIEPGSVGLLLTNSDVLVDKNYFIDNQSGIVVVPQSGGGANARINDNVLAGNFYGIVENSFTATAPLQPVQFYNNTVAFNTVGFDLLTQDAAPVSADIANNIFWQNDRPQVASGFAIASSTPDKLIVRFNLFSNNHGGIGTPAFETLNVGGGFDPANLGPTPDAFGNITGNPSFRSPVDPRPQFDGPANFFVDANFDLTINSAAIDQALQSLAPPTDLLNRPRVSAGRARPGTGPADLGAFEFQPTVSVVVPRTFPPPTTGGTTTPIVSTPTPTPVTPSTTPVTAPMMMMMPATSPPTPAPSPNPTDVPVVVVHHPKAHHVATPHAAPKRHPVFHALFRRSRPAKH